MSVSKSRKRAAVAGYGTISQKAVETVDYLRRGDDVSPHILIGPIVWENDPNLPGRCFIVGTGDKSGARFDSIGASKELAEQFHQAICLELITRRPPLVLHCFDDEIEMLRWAERLWPGERVSQIRRDTEAEHEQCKVTP